MARKGFVFRWLAVAVLSLTLGAARPVAAGGGHSAWRARSIGSPARVPVLVDAGYADRAPLASVAAAERAAVVPAEAEAKAREAKPRPKPHLLVKIPHSMVITSRPGGGQAVGTMPAGSKYYGVPTVAWVEEISENGRFGKVTVPYSGARRTGWIRLQGLQRLSAWVTVRIDLSRHQVVVEKRGDVVMRVPAATGSASSPTPPGHYFVTDRVPFPPGHVLGHFAFGISGVQTRLPAGWSGGNQLAIHGTNNPASIGTSASAGCLRVSAQALDRMKPLLRLGTPVVISR